VCPLGDFEEVEIPMAEAASAIRRNRTTVLTRSLQGRNQREREDSELGGVVLVLPLAPIRFAYSSRKRSSLRQCFLIARPDNSLCVRRFERFEPPVANRTLFFPPLAGLELSTFINLHSHYI